MSPGESYPSSAQDDHEIHVIDVRQIARDIREPGGFYYFRDSCLRLPCNNGKLLAVDKLLKDIAEVRVPAIANVIKIFDTDSL